MSTDKRDNPGSGQRSGEGEQALAVRLGAYLDGELSTAEAQEVEALLFRDGDAARLYRGMKGDQANLSAALNAAANRASGDRTDGDLLAVIEREFAARQGAAGLQAAPAGRGAAAVPESPRRWWPQVAAAAAVLVVVLAAGGWWMEYRLGAALSRMEAQHETVRSQIHAAVSRALETQVSGQTVAWSGDGISGEVTPTRTYRSASGDWCREYLRSTRLNGRELSVRGLACRNSEGAWVTVKAEPEADAPGRPAAPDRRSRRGGDGTAGQKNL